MATPLDGTLPPGLELTGAYIIRLNAIDPTTGATVSGVVISGAAYQVEPLDQATVDVLAPEPLLVPLSQ